MSKLFSWHLVMHVKWHNTCLCYTNQDKLGWEREFKEIGQNLRKFGSSKRNFNFKLWKHWPRKIIFAKLTGTVATSWQLWGLLGCYGVSVSLFFAKIALHGSCWTAFSEGVTVALYNPPFSGCLLTSSSLSFRPGILTPIISPNRTWLINITYIWFSISVINKYSDIDWMVMIRMKK